MLKNYSLTPENVDVISDIVNTYMQSLRMPRRGMIRGRLTVESVLLNWLSSAPEGTEIFLKLGKQFLRPYVRLYFEGAKIDPFDNEDLEEGEYYNQIMANAGLVVDYQYKRGYNFVDIKLPMVGVGNGQTILISVLASLVTVAWISSFDPAVVDLVAKEMVVPVFHSFVNILSGVAAFMVFFSVANGVLRMGNVNNLSSRGKRIFQFVLGRNVLSLILSFLVGAYFFDVVDWRLDLSYNVARNFFTTLAGIVPGNLVQPFIDANTTQLIFMAGVAGVILLTLGSRLKIIYDFVSECDIFFRSATTYFCNIVPLVVYLALTSVMLDGEFQKIGMLHLIIKILLVVALVSLLYVLMDTFWASDKYKGGKMAYFQLVAPVTSMGLVTGNAPACGELWDRACAKFDFERRAYDYSSIVCQIISVPGFLIVFVLTVMGFQEAAGMRITVAEIILSGIVYLLTAPSASAIPGGSISVMAILLAQNNFPQHYIAIYIASNLLFDMLITGVNNASSINNMLGASKILKEVDHDKF